MCSIDCFDIHNPHSVEYQHRKNLIKPYTNEEISPAKVVRGFHIDLAIRSQDIGMKAIRRRSVSKALPLATNAVGFEAIRSCCACGI